MYEERKATMQRILNNLGFHNIMVNDDAVTLNFDTGEMLVFEFDNVGINAMLFIKIPFDITGRTLTKTMEFAALYNFTKKWPHLEVSDEGDVVVCQYVYLGSGYNLPEDAANFALLSVITFIREDEGMSWKKQLMKVILNSLEPNEAIEEMNK